MTVDPNTPHDALVKELLGSPGDAAAVLETLLPREVSAAIDWASLERDDTELRAKGEALLVHDREQAELLLGYLTLTTKLTGPVLAGMLARQGARRAASTMSTMKELLVADYCDRVFAEGEREGQRKTLVKLLNVKFGSLTEDELGVIERADDERLQEFLERVLTADSVAAVLGPE